MKHKKTEAEEAVWDNVEKETRDKIHQDAIKEFWDYETSFEKYVALRNKLRQFYAREKFWNCDSVEKLFLEYFEDELK